MTARQPLEHAERRFPWHGVGFGLPFAKLAQAKTRRQTVIVGCAFGGTGFGSNTTLATLADGSEVTGSWDAALNRSLLTNCVARGAAAMALNPALPPGAQQPAQRNPASRVLALLWHQGENDSHMAESWYLRHLQALVDALRSGIPGASLAPFLAGGLSPAYFPQPPASERVLMRIGDRAYFGRPRCGFASSRLPAPVEAEPGQNAIHLSAKGQRALGRRFFEAWEAIGRREGGGLHRRRPPADDARSGLAAGGSGGGGISSGGRLAAAGGAPTLERGRGGGGAAGGGGLTAAAAVDDDDDDDDAAASSAAVVVV